MKIRIAGIIIFFLSLTVFGQQSAVDSIRQCYDDFDYNKVIELTNEFFKSNDSISFDLFSELMLMKSVSLYVKNDQPGVRNCFFQILQKDRNYLIDTDKVSPKIVKIFKEVKEEYESFIPVKKIELPANEEKKPEVNYVYIKEKDAAGSVIKSVLFPGWTQLETGSIKGYVLGGLAAANIAGIVYYIFDTNKKETEYLAENRRELIDGKYSSFNNSYRIRNNLIISYAVLSLYSAADLLFFDTSTLKDNLTISSYETPRIDYGVSFTFHF